MVTLSAEARSQPFMVRNLSTYGALLEGRELPREGAPAFLRRGRLQVSGVVAWSSGSHCGVRFRDPIVVKEWVKRVGSDEQYGVDAAIADIRSGRGKAAALPSPAGDRDLELAASAGADLKEICERIASLPGMSVELAEELLKIDVIAQSLRGTV